MTFEEVLPALRAGKQVRREGWDVGTEIFFPDGSSHLKIQNLRISGEVKPCFMAGYDLLADDWQIVDKEVE